MHVPALLGLAAIVALSAYPVAYSQADDAVELINSKHTFVDSNGMTNIVGIVNNRGAGPITVTMALDVSDGSTLYEGLYGRIIFPGEGAPFKFRLAPGVEAAGEPYIAKVEQVDAPLHDALVLDYDNMAVGEGRVLKGTVRNTGDTEFHDVYVYASVHGEDMADIDSVKSNVIPILRPGEEAEFVASPDPAVKSQVYYYSCAGLDPNAPISTVPTGDGGFIPYGLQTVSKISSLKYDNTTDSITFGITPYNPAGGDVLADPAAAVAEPDRDRVPRRRAPRGRRAGGRQDPLRQHVRAGRRAQGAGAGNKDRARVPAGAGSPRRGDFWGNNCSEAKGSV
ncbi:FxLYD domain-containing protein [Candidatus Nitrososphaera sp. FF02]|uniref:FxLYD domain-containing protein n=1 Tax=Candidatus Nitrososphaera sp. FF02 TaxID=3398226 RepID=UPI0039E97079